ncbi:MAG: UDP-N-acetylmuramoyl-tripeptide--D-alanyl-D-alanine ligase [Elusimicrobia bacterium]|nr:UDP-N-acetylmuramoyl-tripeptide--D-alanyl-D-alanine ligase [Elusimicrobiota bacterium]
MNLNIKTKKLAKIIDGKIIKGKNVLIRSFSTDTRKIKPGEVFWALKGDNYNADNFIKEALEKKASGIICSKGAFPESLKEKTDFVIETKDTLKALQKLAAFHIKKSKIPVICVTGSNGKTTTKEMIKHILSKKYEVCSNYGNFNNRFGLPLSVLEIEKKHECAVFELGASQRGDVANLAKIIRPDISVITTIGPEHLEFFKSMSNIYKTETEAIDYLKKGGKFIYNRDNKWLRKLEKKKISKLSFGTDINSNLKIIKKDKKYFFAAENGTFSIKIKNPALHNYFNAAAAFLAAKEMGIKEKVILKALKDFPGVKMRMQEIRYGKSVIIFDAYNSNPQSLDAFLEETDCLAPQFLFLGDMKELGKFSSYYHKEAAKKILKRQAEKIFLIGPEMKKAADFLKGKKENVKYFTGVKEALRETARFFNKNKKAFFLFKGSRSVGLENLLPDKIRNKTSLKGAR